MDTAEEIVTPGAAASAFKNPSMLAALQGRLDTLVGAPSEYIQSLPGEVHRRLDALKNLQDEGNVFNVQFRKEVEELEKKYLKLAIPLYKKRTDIITGAVEPTDSEVERKPDEEEEEEERLPVSKENPVKGIPEFWLTALKNMRYISELITEDDEPALAKLVDIKLSYLSSPGFQLSFVFDNNDYFTNSVLTKAYYMMESEDPSVDEVMFDRAEGCEIDWKAGKDLSVTIEVKKQRHKATNKTRTVKKAVPKETFFSFFSPPAPPTEEDEDDEEKFDEYDERIQIDYEIGEMIKDKLIPKAVDWFTGKALEYEDHDEDDYDDEFDGEDDEDDEDEEDDDHVGPSKKTIGSKSNPASGDDKAPECKQQ